MTANHQKLTSPVTRKLLHTTTVIVSAARVSPV
ncbi:hypothetical protein J2Y55_000961 [Bosea sp. BE125]|nr:hypothetical protein [Bosea sp. BE125]